MIYNSKDGEEAWKRDWAAIFDGEADHTVDERFDVSDENGVGIATARGAEKLNLRPV